MDSGRTHGSNHILVISGSDRIIDHSAIYRTRDRIPGGIPRDTHGPGWVGSAFGCKFKLFPSICADHADTISIKQYSSLDRDDRCGTPGVDYHVAYRNGNNCDNQHVEHAGIAGQYPRTEHDIRFTLLESCLVFRDCVANLHAEANPTGNRGHLARRAE